MNGENAREHVSEEIEGACDYCGARFLKKRPWAKFCCAEHRRAFEKIVTRITGKLTPEIRAGVRELLKVRGLDA